MLKKLLFLSIRQLLFVVFVTVVISYIFILGIQNIYSYYTLFNSFQNLQYRHAKELDRNRYFKESIRLSKYDEYWDTYIRSDLGFVLPNEVVYRFYEDE